MVMFGSLGQEIYLVGYVTTDATANCRIVKLNHRPYQSCRVTTYLPKTPARVVNMHAWFSPRPVPC
jgi:hypothetical protein